MMPIFICNAHTAEKLFTTQKPSIIFFLYIYFCPFFLFNYRYRTINTLFYSIASKADGKISKLILFWRGGKAIRKVRFFLLDPFYQPKFCTFFPYRTVRETVDRVVTYPPTERHMVQSSFATVAEAAGFNTRIRFYDPDQDPKLP